MFWIAFGLVQRWTSPKVIPFAGITFGRHLPPTCPPPWEVRTCPTLSPLLFSLLSPPWAGGWRAGASVLQRAQIQRPGDLAENTNILAIWTGTLASAKMGTVPESTRQLRTGDHGDR